MKNLKQIEIDITLAFKSDSPEQIEICRKTMFFLECYDILNGTTHYSIFQRLYNYSHKRESYICIALKEHICDRTLLRNRVFYAELFIYVSRNVLKNSYNITSAEASEKKPAACIIP